MQNSRQWDCTEDSTNAELPNYCVRSQANNSISGKLARENRIMQRLGVYVNKQEMNEKKTKQDIYVSCSTRTGHKIALLFSVSAGQQSDNGIPQCACILFLFCIFSPYQSPFHQSQFFSYSSVWNRRSLLNKLAS